jgi:26S proteasome regulatory subunit N9
LTTKLFEFFENPSTKPYRVEVFERFVRDFEARINQLRLVELAVKVSKEVDSGLRI